MNRNTSSDYDSIIRKCREIFEKKMQDYGSSWRILRTSSLTDQIYIKAQRIRTIEQKKTQKIKDDIGGEYVGIINYAIMALIQLKLGASEQFEMPLDEASKQYDDFFLATKSLMEKKNHDYGEAWRSMRISSMTDLILMKLLRIKQIEDNDGTTIISEGIDANYQDIINYAVFALMKMNAASEVVEN